MDFDEMLAIENKEDLVKFVDQLVQKNERDTEHEDVIGFEHSVPHKGFIDNNTLITNADSTVNFTTNEYAYLFFRGLIGGKVDNLDRAANLVYYFIRKYFGLDGDEKEREKLFMGNIEPFSIDMFRGKNAAVCAERAAVAQNLFSLLGIESYYIVGQLDGINHAFNVINYNDNYYLYDASTEETIYENGKVKDWKAYIKPINDENLESLFKGEKVDMPDGRCYSSFSPYKRLNNHK